MDDEDSERIRKKNPLASHCDVPLTMTNARKALLRPAPSQYIRSNNPCRREYQQMNSLMAIREPDQYDLSKIQRFLLSEMTFKTNSWDMLEFRQALLVAQELYDIQVSSTLDHLGLSSQKHNLTLLSNNPLLIQAYLRKCFWEEGVVMSSSHSTMTGSWWTRKGDIIQSRFPGFDVLASTNLMLLQTNDNTFLVSRAHLTMISDLASQRFSLILQGLLGDQSDNDNLPTVEEVCELLDIGDCMLGVSGNNAYDLIYSLETSCTSRLAGNYEGGLWENSAFRKEIESEMVKKATDLSILDLYLARETLLTKVFERNKNAFTQLYGLYRIWGHPTLEPLYGTISLKPKVLTGRFYCTHHADSIAEKFKEDFIIRYLNRHKEWPDLDMSELPSTHILRVHYENKMKFPLKDPRYRRSHLSLVKFKKIFPVDPKFDIIEFIEDKSLSLDFPELIEEITQRKGIGSALSRSLLLAFLSSEISDPEEFLNKVEAGGFPDVEICFGVHEKEREGKLKARLFGLLTYCKRSYVVLTERILAEHLFPYFPEITMTDDELALERKRLNFTANLERTYLASLDFSKWNSNMRDPDTRPFFEIIDNMFGYTHCFTRTHELFYNTFVYLIDGSYVPTVTDTGLQADLGCWSHHLGGMEGMRQKGWTLWTIILIRLVAEKYSFKLGMMGQGDNQMLAMTFQEELPLDVMISQVKSFLADLSQKLKCIGPPLKLEETWVSQNYYLYGKYPVLSGVPLTMSWKRSCRMFRCCNEDYPTIESSLSSLAANLFAAIASDNFTQSIFLVYLIELIGLLQVNFRRPYLQEEPFYDLIAKNPYITISCGDNKKKQIRLDNPLAPHGQLQHNKLLIALCLTPRTLGGFPVVLYPSTLVKGFPDQLSYDIASLKIFYRYASPSVRVIILRSLRPFLSDDLNYELLAMNTEALNLENTSSPSEARRTLMLNFLQDQDQIVTQPYVVEFLNLLEDNDNELLDYLTAPDDLHPKIINVMMQATPVYRAKQVVGKIQKTPTLARLYQKRGDRDLHVVLERSELNHVKSILRQCCGTSRTVEIDLNDCAVDIATKLRNTGWKKNIIGVDSAPPHEVFKLEMLSDTTTCDEENELDKGFITIRLCANNQVSSDATQKGPVYPYRGSVTKNKINSLSTKIQAKTPSLLQKALQVAELEQWVYAPGSPLSRLAQALLDCVTDIPYHTLVPQLDQISGSYQHRLRNDRTDNGGVCSVLPTQATKLQINTVPLVYLSKGSKNKNAMFQSPLVLAVTVLGEGLLNGTINPPEHRVIHMHIQDSGSIKDLDESPPDYTGIRANLSLHKNKDSPFLFFPQDKIMPYIARALKYPVMSRETLSTIEVNDRYHSLLAYDGIEILDAWSWTSGQPSRQVASGVTINWALNCDIVHYLTTLTLLLLAMFYSIEFTCTTIEYINQIVAIVRNSPASSWENLSNICFNPQYPQALLTAMKGFNMQTSEFTTNTSVASNIRAFVLSKLTSYKHSPSMMSKDLTDLVAPPSVALPLHPYRVMSIIKLLSTNKQIHFSQTRPLRKSELTAEVLSSETLTTITVPPHHRMIRGGISSESLDHLCKVITLKRPIVADIKQSHEVSLQDIKRSMTRPDTSKVYTRDSLETGLETFDTSNQSTHILPPMTSRDFKSLKYRPLPLPASGSYKLADIMTHIDTNDIQKTAAFADGTGGFTRVLALDPNIQQVFFNTLIKPDNYVSQMDPIQSIPDITDLPEENRIKVQGLHEVNNFLSDITDPQYAQFLEDRYPDGFDLITGDAESTNLYHPSGTLTMLEAYRRLSIVTQCKVGIFKIQARTHLTIGVAIVILLSYYDNVQLVRSNYSKQSNAEIYLICRRPTVCSLTSCRVLSNGMKLSVDPHLTQTETLNLYQDVNALLSPPSDNTEANMKNDIRKMTLYLAPHMQLHNLRDVLLLDFPWIQVDNFLTFEGTQLPLRIPFQLNNWIHQTHRGDTRGLLSAANRTRSDSFSAAEIKQICKSFVFMHLYHMSPMRFAYAISTILNSGVLIWTPNDRNRWMFFLYTGNLPPIEELESTHIYSIGMSLNHVAIQRICRQIGLAEMLGLIPDPDHIDQFKVNPFVPDKFKPMNNLVADMLTTPNSIIDGESITSKSLLSQHKRITSKRHH